MKTIFRVTRVSGGWDVTVEVHEAYTDGTSRFDVVFVPDGRMPPAPDADELLAAVDAAIEEQHGHRLGPFRAAEAIDVEEWGELKRSGVDRPVASGRLKKAKVK